MSLIVWSDLAFSSLLGSASGSTQTGRQSCGGGEARKRKEGGWKRTLRGGRRKTEEGREKSEAGVRSKGWGWGSRFGGVLR